MVRDLERMAPELSPPVTRTPPELDYRNMVTGHNKRVKK
jgi:hypothetical protein